MTWLGIMPAIPFSDGVPIISKGHRIRAVVVALDTVDGVESFRIADGSGPAGWVPITTPGWRADLSRPQGFGYALRHLFTYGTGPDEAKLYGPRWEKGGLDRIAWRCLLDRTTDTDRLALARALAEVTR